MIEEYENKVPGQSDYNLNYEGKADGYYLRRMHEQKKKQKLRQEQNIQENKEEKIEDLEKKFNPDTIEGIFGDH